MDKALIVIIFGLVFGFIALPIARGRVLDGPKDTLRRRFLFGAVWGAVLYLAFIVLSPGPDLPLLLKVLAAFMGALVGGGVELVWYSWGRLERWLKTP